jgi:hypothetical protein
MFLSYSYYISVSTDPASKATERAGFLPSNRVFISEIGVIS